MSYSQNWDFPLGLTTLTPSTRSGLRKKVNESCSAPYFVNLSGSQIKAKFSNVCLLSRGSPNGRKVSIEDDLSHHQNRERQDLKDLCTLAKKQKIDARLSRKVLVIEGARYLHKGIPKPPHDLKLSDAKLVKCKGGIAFQGPATYLSNLHQGSIYIQRSWFHLC